MFAILFPFNFTSVKLWACPSYLKLLSMLCPIDIGFIDIFPLMPSNHLEDNFEHLGMTST
jgi:hypothetical protein